METFFINLLRGTGLRGLTGISVTNGRLIRPLLFSTRKEILDYALQKKIPFREDSSNASTKYLRNKIRLGIVPRIKEISPQFTETMTSNVERPVSYTHLKALEAYKTISGSYAGSMEARDIQKYIGRLEQL